MQNSNFTANQLQHKQQQQQKESTVLVQTQSEQLGN